MKTLTTTKFQLDTINATRHEVCDAKAHGATDCWGYKALGNVLHKAVTHAIDATIAAQASFDPRPVVVTVHTFADNGDISEIVYTFYCPVRASGQRNVREIVRLITSIDVPADIVSMKVRG